MSWVSMRNSAMASSGTCRDGAMEAPVADAERTAVEHVINSALHGTIDGVRRDVKVRVSVGDVLDDI